MTAIKARFFVSVAANAFRAGVTFTTGILIARGLSPSGYGDLAFLLGSFVAIRVLLDMGSSSAFYTFLSQRTRGRQFYQFYFSWLALQFIITLACVTFIIPANLFWKIWQGHSHEIVALAFVATFVQQQIWQMIGQIGEASRKTKKVQLLNVSVAVINLLIIGLLLLSNAMSLERVLSVTVSLYSIAIFLGYYLLKTPNEETAQEEMNHAQMLREYWVYCKPMLGFAVISFMYSFADKWMLQKFGGPIQQGFFQVATQFAQVSLLATVSILNIFWKEIAEASAKGDSARVAILYQKVTRGLVMLSAIVAGLLMPWSKQIVAALLGPAYSEAWPVLAIMFLYPIHQSMGQIGGTMFMARGNTKRYVFLSSAIMLFVSLPLAYFSLAPSSGMLIPGLGLGAIGMACYMVLSGIIGVNIQAWVLARDGGWRFNGAFQIIGIPLMLGFGYITKMLIGLIWNLDKASPTDLIIPAVCTCIIYAPLVFLAVWRFPWMFGLEKKELQMMIQNLRKGLQRAIV